MSAPDRRPFGRLLPVLVLLGAAAGSAGSEEAVQAPAAPSPVAPAAVLPTVEEWERLGFWARLARTRIADRTRASMSGLVDPLLVADPDDLLGNFLRSRTLVETEGEAPGDSAEIAAIVRAGEEPGATAGQSIAAASVHLIRRDSRSWRSSLDRARAAYDRAGREHDAFCCLLLKTNYRAGQRDRALLDADLEELRIAAEASGDPGWIADHRLMLGKSEYTRDLEGSVGPRAEAVRLLEPLGPSYPLAYAHWGLGNSLRRLDRLEEATAEYEGTVRVAVAVGAPDLEADGHLGLGQVLRRQGDPVGALAHFEAAAEARESIGDLGRLVPVLLNFRPLYHELGDRAAARASAERSLELARGHGSRRAVVAALDGFASEEAIVGRLESARRLYAEAIELGRASGATRELIYLHLHLSGLESDVRDYDSAERVARDGLAIAEELGDEKGRRVLEVRLLQIALHRGEYERALAGARELAADPSPDPRLRHDAARVQARATDGLGRPEEALALYDELLVAMSAENAGPTRRARTLDDRGRVLLDLGREDEAIASFRESVRLAEGDPNYAYVARLGLATGLAQAGQWEEARPLLEEALDHVEAVNSGLTVGEERSSYLVHWYDDYLRLARAYLETGRPADAFAVLERARARELRRALRSGAPGLETKVTPALAADLLQVEGELSLVQKSLVEQAAGAHPVGGAPDPARLAARADSLKQRRSELVAAIERERPHFAREIGLLPQIGLAGLQARLGPGELVLATMSGTRTGLLFVVGHDELEARELPWTEDEVRALVGAAVDGVRAAPGTEGTGVAAAQELAAHLLIEVEQFAPHALTILPDGAFHRLPFEILPLADGRRLVQSAEVTYASSATLLADAMDRTPLASSGCVMVAFGDPAVASPGTTEAPGETRGGLPVLRALPHARREVNRLGELLDEACVRIGNEATEGAFFREAGHTPVVHVAAHAFVDDTHPGYSGIVLASDDPDGGGPGTDGLVQAFEVVRAELPANLVTLSACETGRGEWQRGEGLIGLARAFRIAGARSLIVSLWEVDDEATADFMVRLYEHLIAGATPAAALRAAKLSFLVEPSGGSGTSGGTRGVARRTGSDRPDPAIWAAFVLLGPGPNPFPPAE